MCNSVLWPLTVIHQESKLRLVRYLPDILKLQRLLVDKYYRRISREEARKQTVAAFLRSLHNGDILLQLHC